MRHRNRSKNFRRSYNHKKAMIRNLVYSLVDHGRIKTTLTKAKELRRHAERAVTIGKRGGLNSVRLLLKKYPNKKIVFNVVDNLSQKFKDRSGGYTRIIKLGKRFGDNAEMAFIEWVDYLGVSKLGKKEEKVVDKKQAKGEEEQEEKAKKGSTKKNKSRKAKLVAQKIKRKKKRTKAKSTSTGVKSTKPKSAKPKVKSTKPKSKKAVSAASSKEKEVETKKPKKRGLAALFGRKKKPKKS